MPIHFSITQARLEDEIALLRKANKRIIAIVPTLIEAKAGRVYLRVIDYAIIFEDETNDET